MRSTWVSALMALAVFLASEAAGTELPTEYRFGNAVGNITPIEADLEREDYFMGGYGLWTSRGIATSIHDPLTVRAMCIAEPEPAEIAAAFCLAVVDALGVPGPMAMQIRRAVAVQTGLDPDAVIVAATHTHASPDLLGLWGGAPAKWRERVAGEAIDVIVSAWHGLMPARLYHAVGKGRATNRRGWEEVDDAVSILLVRDPADTINLGVFVSFSAHPVISPADNLALSSDFVHYARESLTEALAAPVVYASGTLGDVTPGDRGQDYWGDAADYGHLIADTALAALAQAAPVSGKIRFHREPVSLAVDNVVLGLAGALGIIESAMTGPPWDQSVETSVTAVAIGHSLAAIAVPGEPLTRLGLDLKSQMNADLPIVIGLADDSLGYFVPADEWETGRNNDYEESISLGPSAAGRIRAAAIRALRRVGVTPP